MGSMVKIEGKRIVNARVFLIFLIVVITLSAYSSLTSLRGYEIPRADGAAVTWQENLAHGKENVYGRGIAYRQTINAEYLARMRERETEIPYADEENVNEILMKNYDGKSLKDLALEELDGFYAVRLANIRDILEENQKFTYTQEEIDELLGRAGKVTEIAACCAEGWKRINSDMRGFATILILLIAVILLPLAGVDAKTNMKELYRATRNGKRRLGHARIATAYLTGGLLYLTGIAIYFVIKMFPFGMDGWNLEIQSNAGTFFSTYPITNLQQFLLNVMLGFAACLFVTALTVMISVFMEGIMPSAVVFSFFWVLLVILEQMSLWEINYYFANFMPLRLAGSVAYYISNDRYRFAGRSFDSLAVCPATALIITLLMTGITILRMDRFHLMPHTDT